MKDIRKLLNRVTCRSNVPILTWLVWITCGTMFYAIHDEFPLHVAIYQSTSVGWAIGWSLPVERPQADGLVSMIFSALHNCVGVIFVGVSVMYIARAVANSTDDWTVQITDRQKLKDLEVTGIIGRIKRWYLLNKILMRMVVTSIGLILFCILGGFILSDYSFLEAMDMMLSTISCCGYRGLKEDGEPAFLYILLAVYTNVAVPVFAIALASLISLLINTPDEKFFYSKIAAPLLPKEIEYMQTFGIDDGDGLLDVKEFVVLTIIRIGNVAPALVLDAIKQFKQITSKEDAQWIPYSSIKGYQKVTVSGDGGNKKKAVRHTLIQQLSHQDSGTSSSVAPVSSLNLVRSRRQANSVGEAMNMRRERRQTARNSIVQKQNQNMIESQIIQEAKLDNIVRTQLVPFNSPLKGENTKIRVVPEEAFKDDIEVISEEKNAKDNENNMTAVHRSEGDQYNDEIKLHDMQCLPSTMQKHMEWDIDSVEESNQEKECYEKDIDENEVFNKKDAEVSKDDLSFDEGIRPPSEVCTPILGNKKDDCDKSSSSPSIDMGRDSFTKEKEPLAIRYRNSSVLKQRTERRGTFVPSGTYEILTAQSRRKSNLKMQRRRSVAKVLSTPTQLISSTRKSTMMMMRRRITQRAAIRQSAIEEMRKINAAHMQLIKRQSSLRLTMRNSDNFFELLWTLAGITLADPYTQAFLAWLLWLLLATLFYCVKMRISFYRGFYMSVNVGYAIYWTQEESDSIEKTFSVLHIVVGQVMISFALAAFAKGLTNSTKAWYAAEISKAEISSTRVKDDELSDEVACSNSSYFFVFQGYMKNMLGLVYLFYLNHKVHIYCICWLVFGVVWSIMSIGWPLIEGVYFSVTSLSTGGIWSIPEDSTDIQYFIVALFTCTGAPIMCLSGGVFAHWLSTRGEASRLKQTMIGPISLDELHMMIKLDIDDGDGYIDQTEYIILILVRIGAVRPELIAAIQARFKHLDTDSLGAVPYEVFQWNDDTNTENNLGAMIKQ